MIRVLTERVKQMPPFNLSANFSLAEASVTNTGLENEPPNSMLTTLVHTASKMEKVRALLGNVPVKINSWYRGPAVNAKVGGVSNSQHTKGEAVDFVAPRFGDPYAICKLLEQKVGELNFDQLIYEGTWVHISFISKGTPRNQVLTLKGKGYVPGVVR